MRDVAPDIEELERAVKDVEEVNLFTVMSSGKQAFRGLTDKGQVCFELFDTIKDFSVSVAGVAGATNGDWQFDLLTGGQGDRGGMLNGAGAVGG